MYPQAAGAVVEAPATYEPAYYGDYLVYYDTFGTPFYYSGGIVRYIARTDARYPVYVNHYRRYGPAYHRWYHDHGHAHYERRADWVHRGRQYHAPRYHQNRSRPHDHPSQHRHSAPAHRH